MDAFEFFRRAVRDSQALVEPGDLGPQTQARELARKSTRPARNTLGIPRRASGSSRTGWRTRDPLKGGRGCQGPPGMGEDGRNRTKGNTR
ncbi:hypothetical protein [Streptomyces sp. MnatMP-M17]|uniref:hypothetical protein n=1 Tax=Streptomyces sp. MnatMP-M17 TaxID=1839780 RepID=UPI003521D30C